MEPINLAIRNGEGHFYEERCVAIIGNVEYDNAGNKTGLTGWGIAVYTGGKWLDPGYDSGWIAPIFTNSWNNDATYGSVGYRRTGNTVRLRGVMSIGTTAKSAFTLPVGFRPTQVELFTGTQSGGTEAILEIAPTGGVVIYIAGSPGFIGISGITFTID